MFIFLKKKKNMDDGRSGKVKQKTLKYLKHSVLKHHMNSLI